VGGPLDSHARYAKTPVCVGWWISFDAVERLLEASRLLVRELTFITVIYVSYRTVNGRLRAGRLRSGAQPQMCSSRRELILEFRRSCRGWNPGSLTRQGITFTVKWARWLNTICYRSLPWGNTRTVVNLADWQTNCETHV
jgi:hypothetical protein